VLDFFINEAWYLRTIDIPMLKMRIRKTGDADVG
jgi:hypothetical protein